MDPNPFVRVTRALASSSCPFCIAGGFAVVMHGGSRFTPDINVIVPFQGELVNELVARLDECNLSLDESEITLAEFLSNSAGAGTAPKRKFLWFRDRAGSSFSVSFFAWHPLPFDHLIRDRLELSCHDYALPVVSLTHLQDMKAKASRPQDLLDLDNLSIIEQIHRLEAETGMDLDKIRKRLGSVVHDDSRLENLVTFLGLPTEEKLAWLGNMLTMLGQFI